MCQVASVVSDSVQPHGLQPTRLIRPWDSPCKNTGVGMCVYILYTYLYIYIIYKQTNEIKSMPLFVVLGVEVGDLNKK